MQRMADPATGRAWSYLDETGCFVWTGKAGKDGKPIIYRGGQQVSATRIQWERLYGPLPRRCQLVSLCGRGDCVSPYHHVLRGPERALAGKGITGKAVRLLARTLEDMKARVPDMGINWSGSLADLALPADDVTQLATALRSDTLLVHAAYSLLCQRPNRITDPVAIRSAEERVLDTIGALRQSLGMPKE